MVCSSSYFLGVPLESGIKNSPTKSPVVGQSVPVSTPPVSSKTIPLPVQENFGASTSTSTSTSLEGLMKQQILLMKFILLFLGFMLLSNILCKNN